MLLRSIKKLFSTKKLIYHEKLISTGNNPEEKPNLVILHGVLGTGNMYRNIAEHAQTRKRYNSYLLDLPNHGKSFSTQKSSVYQMGDDIANWIKAQNFRKNVTIVAHSLGGRSVVAMTAQHPQLQSIVQPIILLDVATQSYQGFPFHKKTAMYLNILRNINLKTTNQEIQEQLKKISSNDMQFQIIKKSVDFQNKRWNFNLDALVNGYEDIISFHIQKADWKSDIYVIKALKSAFVNDNSKALLKKIYPNVHIIDVDCYHNIQFQKPQVVYDIIHKI